MDPAIISGGGFGQVFSFQAAQEIYYAKPLIYTPTALGRQTLLAFSEANKIYLLDALNGTQIAMRDLALEGESPFIVTDLPNCFDNAGLTVGITGTPVIDTTTDTVYFWAKSYLIPGQSGWEYGAYRFHAIDAATLAEKPGFPVNIQGTPGEYLALLMTKMPY
jgi:hypothetical protein